ncbi:MAG: DUF1297 domain-containing protein [Thermoplasmatota archaeon]
MKVGTKPWVRSVIQSYNKSAITIGALASHSALDLCDGATDEGFPTLAVCQKGRERTYQRYTRIVQEIMLFDKFDELQGSEARAKLRQKNVVFVPNRSFSTYLPIDWIEREFDVPLFGNRAMLRADNRDEQFTLFHKAGIHYPKKFNRPEEIDRLCMVKVPDARNKIERAFFTVGSPEDFRVKMDQRVRSGIVDPRDAKKPWIEEFVLGALFNFNFFYSPLTKNLEFLGLDRRYQTNIDGFLQLPAQQQLDLPPHIATTNKEVGHVAVTIRESILEKVFDAGERVVEASRALWPPGIVGPFALQGAVNENLDVVIFDFSPRMPGSPVLFSSPYSKYFFGHTVTSGRRVAMEIKRAIETDRLDDILS